MHVYVRIIKNQILFNRSISSNTIINFSFLFFAFIFIFPGPFHVLWRSRFQKACSAPQLNSFGVILMIQESFNLIAVIFQRCHHYCNIAFSFGLK